MWIPFGLCIANIFYLLLWSQTLLKLVLKSTPWGFICHSTPLPVRVLRYKKTLSQLRKCSSETQSELLGKGYLTLERGTLVVVIFQGISSWRCIIWIWWSGNTTLKYAHKNCSKMWKKNIILVVELTIYGVGSRASFRQIGKFGENCLWINLPCFFFCSFSSSSYSLISYIPKLIQRASWWGN